MTWTRSLRSLAVIYLITMLRLSAVLVHRLNLDQGGWVLLIGLVSAPLLLATLGAFSGRRMLYHSVLLLATLVLFKVVDDHCVWTATCEVRTTSEVFTFPPDTRYYAPAPTANRFPFDAVNDVWAIRGITDATAVIPWQSPSDTLVQRSELSDVFERRGVMPLHSEERNDGTVPLAILLLIMFAAFAEIAWHFVQEFRWSWAFLRSGKGAAMFFVLGILIASIQFAPTDWLSNDFMSRSDDWACYEKGARQILSGNVWLNPAPGGMEMWSALYAYLLAMAHFLIGPAIGALYIITYGAHYLVIWGMINLLTTRDRWLALFTCIATWLFVEVDMNTHYAWRLLSDTLPLVVLPLLLVAWKRGADLRVLGLLCGLLYLVRLELLGIGPILLAVLFIRDRTRLTKRSVAGFAVVFLACVVPYMVRHHALFGVPMPWPLGMGASGHLRSHELLSPGLYLLKAKALLGHYDLLTPGYRFRYHWLFVHAAFIAALALSLIKRFADRFVLFAVIAWVYVFLTRMASPSVGIYGHRHSLLLILLELVVIALVAERYLLERNAGARPAVA